MKAQWVVGIVMAAGLYAQPKAQPEECRVDVYLLIGVPMPTGMLMNAKTKATQMFREIGVRVRMRNGIPMHDAGDTCGDPIVVQLENAGHYHGSDGALAYATLYKESGTCIHVFIDRVLENLDKYGVPAFSNGLLPHVLVHEITHVLEQVTRHSEQGVMKAVWSDEDYRRMQDHPLPFAPEDVRFIREGIARRATHVAAE